MCLGGHLALRAAVSLNRHSILPSIYSLSHFISMRRWTLTIMYSWTPAFLQQSATSQQTSTLAP